MMKMTKSMNLCPCSLSLCVHSFNKQTRLGRGPVIRKNEVTTDPKSQAMV
jgi:hypothetical protein